MTKPYTCLTCRRNLSQSEAEEHKKGHLIVTTNRSKQISEALNRGTKSMELTK